MKASSITANRWMFWMVSAIVGLLSTYATGRIIYVDDNAPAGGSGTSWTDAYRYLQDALVAAQTDSSIEEIHVAQETYKPDQGVGQTYGDREATFQLINGMAIRGGYAGFGEADPDARNIENYKTILSGDLAENDLYVADPRDLLDEATRDENSYHVVTSGYTDDSAILDGITITSGNADGSSPYCHGAGIYNYAGNPTVMGCTFTYNSAEKYGGAMYNYDSSIMVTDSTFRENLAASRGAGMYIEGGSSCIDNCVFTHNISYNGLRGSSGGIYNRRGDLTVVQCLFKFNRAYCGGGMICSGSNISSVIRCTFQSNVGFGGSGAVCSGANMGILSNCVMSYCIFSANKSYAEGGGLENEGGSTMTLTNCVLVGNVAGSTGGGVYYDGNVTLTNCILWNNRDDNGTVESSQIHGGLFASNLTVNHNCIQNWTGTLEGVGNFGNNPLFVDMDGPDDEFPSNDDDLHLLPNSPCIDAGDPNSDFGLEPEPDGGAINMGAYGNTPEATSKGDLILESYNMVSKDRSGRTIFDYLFTITLHNGGSEDVSNVQLELLDAYGNVLIVDPDVSLASIEAGQSATSEDTFAIRVERSELIDVATISWRANFDWGEPEGTRQQVFTALLNWEPTIYNLAGDTIINLEDFAVLAQHWLQNAPSVNIAGDDIIDVWDLVPIRITSELPI